MMLSIRRSQYRGLHTLSDLKVTTKEGADLPDAHVQAGKITLMPDHWLEKFSKLFRDVATILDRHTTSLRMTEESETASAKVPVLNMRILPTRAAIDVFPALAAKKDEIARTVAALREAYDEEVILWNRMAWVPVIGVDGFEQKILAKLPTKDQLQHKYKLRWSIFKLSAASIGSIKETELREHLAEASRSAREQIDAAFSEMISEPRQMLAEALQKMQERFSDAKVISVATFTEVRDAMARVRAFADVADPELLKKVQDFERDLDNVVHYGNCGRDAGMSFRSSIERHIPAFREMASSLVEQCNNQVAVSGVANQFGVRARGFDL